MESIYEKSKELLNLLASKDTSEKVKEIVSRGVVVEESIPEGALLFLGINPSFDDKKKEESGTYKLENVGDEGFFRKAFQIAKNNGKPFGHHDLFPVRETDQKFIEGMLVHDGIAYRAKSQYKDFVEGCLSYAENIIIQSNPCMIIVANAFLTHLFFDFRFNDNGKKLLGFLPGDKGGIWDERLGADFVHINGRNVPILFSGMLSGQRALDFGSEFRLKWHIGHILRNINQV